MKTALFERAREPSDLSLVGDEAEADLDERQHVAAGQVLAQAVEQVGRARLEQRERAATTIGWHRFNSNGERRRKRNRPTPRDGG
jgi:hypothetical protein